ncbi:MAG TPA: ubiquinol-cytochrome C chaperone family protein [Caulobacteraceae bacterium]|nr:ubiquinol-cytochrome C chaperone family protein [Caulobacteraceae bacterium]
MNLKRMFKPSPARLAGEALYEAAIRQARRPEFYQALGAPDTIEGRFELYNLHVILLLHRLKGDRGAAADAAQALFDAFVGALDHTLREMGVGDLTVPKKMRRLGEAIYGRVKAYDTALAARDLAELSALLDRTVFEGAADAGRAAMAAYVLACADRLAAQPLADILEARPDWPAAPA